MSRAGEGDILRVKMDMLLKLSVFIDIVCDTSDTEPFSEDEEYEPVTDAEDDQPPPVSGDSSGQSDVSDQYVFIHTNLHLSKLSFSRYRTSISKVGSTSPLNSF